MKIRLPYLPSRVPSQVGRTLQHVSLYPNAVKRAEWSNSVYRKMLFQGARDQMKADAFYLTREALAVEKAPGATLRGYSGSIVVRVTLGVSGRGKRAAREQMRADAFPIYPILPLTPSVRVPFFFHW